jgi:hypothetical protein
VRPLNGEDVTGISVTAEFSVHDNDHLHHERPNEQPISE